jgi:hypothetical protein
MPYMYVAPMGHGAHVPIMHTSVPLQTALHWPQSFSSVSRSTQPPLQQVSEGLQTRPVARLQTLGVVGEGSRGLQAGHGWVGGMSIGTCVGLPSNGVHACLHRQPLGVVGAGACKERQEQCMTRVISEAEGVKHVGIVAKQQTRRVWPKQ